MQERRVGMSLFPCLSLFFSCFGLFGANISAYKQVKAMLQFMFLQDFQGHLPPVLTDPWFSVVVYLPSHKVYAPSLLFMTKESLQVDGSTVVCPVQMLHHCILKQVAQ